MQDNRFETQSLSRDQALLFSLMGKDERVLLVSAESNELATCLTEQLACSVTVMPNTTDTNGSPWDSLPAGELFDALILIDFAKNARNAECFLQSAQAHLKENGKILFSIPNAAHAEILVAMANGNIAFSAIGTAEEAPLSALAVGDLKPLFARADLFLYHLDATVRDEKTDTNGSSSLFNLLAERNTALAHRFVGVACHKGYAEKMGLSFRSVLPLEASKNNVRISLDLGEGFSEQDTVLLPSPREEDPTVFMLPSNAHRLKLCIRQDPGYLICSAHFVIGTLPCEPTETFGILKVEDDILITDENAFLIFDLPSDAGSFSFFGSIAVFGDDGTWASACRTANRVQTLLKELEELETRNRSLQTNVENLRIKYNALYSEFEDLEADYQELEYHHAVVLGSGFWRITKPFRVILDAIKRVLRRIPFMVKLKKGLKYLGQHGLRLTCRKARERSAAKKNAKKKLRYSEKTLQAQREHIFPEEHVFSILVPLYNTPKRFLKEMIDSVAVQTYKGWELCLADGSDSEHTDVEEYCRERAASDPRIKYKKLEKNMGISENTNACIDMATGDFIALFDHDDILHPSALYEFMRVICEEGADFVYTDEATFESPHLKKIITIHHKPDFAMDNLRANNYICHFSTFSRTVLEKAGRFRKEFDGSQDHDMILRLTEAAQNIVHIPKILYFWRSHPLSVAMDINSKTYAIEAGKAAVRESVLRAGMNATVESSRAFPTIYRIRYTIPEEKKVSIIIPNKNHLADLRTCLNSITALSTYSNYEIILVDDDSTDPALFEYYERLEKKENVKILTPGATLNSARLRNCAAEAATGDYLIFLHNNLEIITPEWMEEMMMYAQREDVGAVGGMLYYADNTIRHAGIILGLGKQQIADFAFHKCDRKNIGYMGRLCYTQNMSAVSGDFMMVNAALFRAVGGFDETLAFVYSDIDLCLKIRAEGKNIIWTPYAEAYHYEFKSQKRFRRAKDNRKQQEDEAAAFREKWGDVIQKGDPYYNPNFSLTRSDFWIS